MTLDDGKLEQYREEGFTWVRGLISKEEAHGVRKRMLEIMEGQHDWPPRHFQILDPARFRNSIGGHLLVGIQQPAAQETVFEEITDHANLSSAFAQLLGGPVKRFTDQALIKSPEISGESFYHQDSFYWKIDPERGCNAWIALDEVGENASALAILPGSQKGWELTEHEKYYDEPSYHRADNEEAFTRWRIPTDGTDLSDEVLLPMNPGDAAFFSNYTWHRSEPNRSGSYKTAYAIAYELDD